MNKFALTLFALATINQPVSADETIPKSELKACAGVYGELMRLDCFDAIAMKYDLTPKGFTTGTANAGSYEAPPVKEPSPSHNPNPRSNDFKSSSSKWITSISVNPIDDSKTVTLILQAMTGHGRFGGTPSLIIRCKSNVTDVYITWHEYLARNGDVLSRIGSNEAVTTEWSLSTDAQATFHPRAISFAKELFISNKLVAQITPFNESPVTSIFDTTGLEEEIKPLRETCNW